MKVMQVSRVKGDLSPPQEEAFQLALQKFYASPPGDLVIAADYVTVDRSRSFTLLEVASLARLDEINKPFEPFVDYEVFEVRPASEK